MRTIAVAFRDHQNDILQRLDDAETLMSRQAAPSSAELRDVRIAIGRAMDAYRTFKHGRVYDPIIASGGPDAEAAAALKEDCEELTAAFRAHMAAADAMDPATDQIGAMRLIAAQVKQALIREFALVQQLGVYRDYAGKPA